MSVQCIYRDFCAAALTITHGVRRSLEHAKAAVLRDRAGAGRILSWCGWFLSVEFLFMTGGLASHNRRRNANKFSVARHSDKRFDQKES
jgi:hypothetical protein